MTDELLTQVRLCGASVDFIDRSFAKPLHLSGGIISRISEARVEVRVQLGKGKGTGRGSIYLSDLWAWPDSGMPHEQCDAVLRNYCTEIAKNLSDTIGPPAHPLELGMRLHQTTLSHSSIPPLAAAMCASPFDAAIHDAVGQALGISAFRFYEGSFSVPSADPYFAGGSAIKAVRAIIRETPAQKVHGCHVVGAGDDWEEGLSQATGSGFSQFKLKLRARSAEEDALRVSQVFRKVIDLGVKEPGMSLDSNEGNPDAKSVLEFLQTLGTLDPQAFSALHYLEQPTGRDIRLHAFDWKKVAEIRPVLLDEGLTDLSLLSLAREQGWNGLALKTCKGHSFVLCAAALGFEKDMLLSVQDLTNPGLAAIHSFLLAAHLQDPIGFELNSPQFTPAANAEWLPRLAPLFHPSNGTHQLADSSPPGLGTSL